MYLPPLADGEEWIGVLVAIPEPWVTELTDIRRAAGDLQADHVPAHITLLPPTAVSIAQREQLFHHLSQVAQMHQPFTLTVSGAGSFRPVSPVSFAAVTDGFHELVELAEDIRSDVLDIPLRFPYHPHVTLAHGVEESALNQVEAAVADFYATWQVPGFRLDRVDTEGRYSSLALFNFEAR